MLMVVILLWIGMLTHWQLLSHYNLQLREQSRFLTLFPKHIYVALVYEIYNYLQYLAVLNIIDFMFLINRI